MESKGSLPCSQEPSTGLNPVHTTPSYLSSILILSTHLRLGLASALFPFGFPTNILYELLFHLSHATCPAHRIILDWIILIVLGEKYTLWRSSLCSLFQPPITSSLFGKEAHICNWTLGWWIWETSLLLWEECAITLYILRHALN
jgi:hypothetical protein